MKKLSLKKLNLGANNKLQRNQLKAVYGGYNYFCQLTCYDNGSSGIFISGVVSSVGDCNELSPSEREFICNSSGYNTSYITPICNC